MPLPLEGWVAGFDGVFSTSQAIQRQPLMRPDLAARSSRAWAGGIALNLYRGFIVFNVMFSVFKPKKLLRRSFPLIQNDQADVFRKIF